QDSIGHQHRLRQAVLPQAPAAVGLLAAAARVLGRAGIDRGRRTHARRSVETTVERSHVAARSAGATAAHRSGAALVQLAALGDADKSRAAITVDVAAGLAREVAAARRRQRGDRGAKQDGNSHRWRPTKYETPAHATPVAANVQVRAVSVL